MNLDFCPNSMAEIDHDIEQIQQLFQRTPFNGTHQENPHYLSAHEYFIQIEKIYDALPAQQQKGLMRALLTKEMLLSRLFPHKDRTLIHFIADRFEKYVLQSNEFTDTEQKDMMNYLIGEHRFRCLFSQNLAVDRYLLTHHCFEKQERMIDKFSYLPRNSMGWFYNERILDININYLAAFWYALFIPLGSLADNNYAKPALIYLRDVIEKKIGSIEVYRERDISEDLYHQLLNMGQEDLSNYQEVQKLAIELNALLKEIDSLDKQICDELFRINCLSNFHEHLQYRYQLISLHPFYEQPCNIEASILDRLKKEEVENWIARSAQWWPKGEPDAATATRFELLRAKYTQPESYGSDEFKNILGYNLTADKQIIRLMRDLRKKEDFFLQTLSKLTSIAPKTSSRFPHEFYRNTEINTQSFLNEIRMMALLCSLKMNRLNGYPDSVKLDFIRCGEVYYDDKITTDTDYIELFLQSIHMLFNRYTKKDKTINADDLSLDDYFIQFESRYDHLREAHQRLLIQKLYEQGVLSQYLFPVMASPIGSYIPLFARIFKKYILESGALDDKQQGIITRNLTKEQFGYLFKDSAIAEFYLLNFLSLTNQLDTSCHLEAFCKLQFTRFKLSLQLEESKSIIIDHRLFKHASINFNPVLQLQHELNNIREILLLQQVLQDIPLRLIELKLKPLLSGIFIADKIEQLEPDTIKHKTTETVFLDIRNLAKLCEQKLNHLNARALTINTSQTFEQKHRVTSQIALAIDIDKNSSSEPQSINEVVPVNLDCIENNLKETEHTLDSITVKSVDNSYTCESIKSTETDSERYPGSSSIDDLILFYNIQIKNETEHTPDSDTLTAPQNSSIIGSSFSHKLFSKPLKQPLIHCDASKRVYNPIFSLADCDDFEHVDNPMVSLADGNCAYNSMVLFLRSCFLDRRPTPWLSCVLDKLNQNKDFAKMNIETMTAYFKTTSAENAQRHLSPFLRIMATDFMNTMDTRDTFLEHLSVVVEFMIANPQDTDIPYADTFLVHPFIEKKLNALKNNPTCIKAQLKTWWCDQGGFNHYLAEISQPATNANDRARWGADPELNSLSQLLACNIHLSNNNEGSRCMGQFEHSPHCYLEITGVHWSFVKCSTTSPLTHTSSPS